MRDIEIRELMHNEYLSNFTADGESVVVDEFPICVGRTIADVAVVNGSLHAYEIKGSYDTLARLSKQLSDYAKVFDFITVVTTSNHLKSVLKQVPVHCGVWLIRHDGDKVTREIIREATRNLTIDSFSLAQLLWRDEAIDLMTSRGIVKGLKSKRRWLLWEEISTSLPAGDLSHEVRRLLKSRSNWKSKIATTNFVQPLPS